MKKSNVEKIRAALKKGVKLELLLAGGIVAGASLSACGGEQVEAGQIMLPEDSKEQRATTPAKPDVKDVNIDVRRLSSIIYRPEKDK